jgi:hypothetical protein
MKYNRLGIFSLYSPFSPFSPFTNYSYEEGVYNILFKKRGERGEWEKRGERLENVKRILLIYNIRMAMTPKKRQLTNGV